MSYSVPTTITRCLIDGPTAPTTAACCVTSIIRYFVLFLEALMMLDPLDFVLHTPIKDVLLLRRRFLQLARPGGPIVAEILGNQPRAPRLGPKDQALWRAPRLERGGYLLGLVQRDPTGGRGNNREGVCNDDDPGAQQKQ